MEIAQLLSRSLSSGYIKQCGAIMTTFIGMYLEKAMVGNCIGYGVIDRHYI